MVRLLGLNRLGSDPSPREITRTNPITGGESSGVGENGWLIRFFDSAFFCEWIAVSYLYKHDHAGVRDYLCNRMYTLPLAGLENYLFQICYMLVHKPSPSLDKFVIDTCSKSLRISLKVHWFLMAELEDSDDNEGISRIQEKCQIAATLMGEWAPLSRSGFGQSSSPSPKSHPVLNRLLSSKQKLLSLASSQALSLPVEERLSNSEENKLLKKLMPGPKVRDAIFFRKSMEKEEESDKDGFFKRLLRDSKDKEEEDGDKDGFFKRLIRDSKDEEDDGDKDGLLKRFPRDSKDEDDQELCSSSDGFLKRLFRDKEEKLGEEDEKDKEGFFRRIFKDKMNEEKNEEGGRGSRSFEEDEKDSFFRKIFKDKNEERKDNAHERNKEEHKSSRSIDEDDNESFFAKIFKDKNNEKKDVGHDRSNEEEDTGVRKRIEDDDRDGFFRRLFKDKADEKRVIGHDKNEDEKCNGSTEDAEKEGFFRKIFKDKHDQERKDEGHAKEHSKCNGSIEEEETSEFLSFRRLFRVHPEDGKSSGVNANSGSPLDSSPGTENFFKRLFRDRDRSIEDSELFGSKKHTELRPGTPRQQNEKAYTKPPLPNNAIAQIRKASYHAALEFVQSLCDTSYGLVDIFPIEDRKNALRESLVEINSLLADAKKCGGVCFPMGKGMYRVVNVPEDEAVLLNSREKAPYLICLEVLKCELPSITKAASDAKKQAKGGIPLANGDAQLPKPPPWAYPLWNQFDIHRIETDRMLRSTSQAIDRAMAQLWEAKVKFVNVSLSVEKRVSDFSKCSEDTEPGNTFYTPLQSPSVTKDPPRISAETIYYPANDNRIDDDHDLEWVSVCLSAVPGVKMEDVDDQQPPPRRKDHRRVPSTIAMEEVKAAAAKGQAPPGLPLKGAGQNSSDERPKVTNGGVPKPTDALSGELWETRKERIRSSSTYGKLPGWDLRSFIVKSGDDCRQEHLAVQLVAHLYDIYQEAGLPLWLHPYEVLVTSSYTALIETIHDTASIHAIKSRFPGISSLRDFFVSKYEENSPSFKLAQIYFYVAVENLNHMEESHSLNATLETIRRRKLTDREKERCENQIILIHMDPALMLQLLINSSCIPDDSKWSLSKGRVKNPMPLTFLRNFVESMAGYSILCYLLQVKDRHNGNLLIDEEGHIIHIDFGFMLSNSPGGVNFESAPFKLTRELLEVMDSDAEGTPSEFFDYFKVLCIQGFLTCRKHAERIILLVEMLQDSGFPCFKGGPRTIQNLRKRFHLSLTEEQCVSLVLSLISSSLDAWRTRQYDYYQRVLNGIL